MTLGNSKGCLQGKKGCTLYLLEEYLRENSSRRTRGRQLTATDGNMMPLRARHIGVMY